MNLMQNKFLHKLFIDKCMVSNFIQMKNSNQFSDCMNLISFNGSFFFLVHASLRKILQLLKNKAITIKKFICFSISLILRSKIIVETIFI